jgi:hypothetical protein
MSDLVLRQFESSVASVKNYIERMKDRIKKLESESCLPPDYARNRVDAILREAVRLHVENIIIYNNSVTATWGGRDMKGEISFEMRGSYPRGNFRPRVRLELYFVDADGCRIWMLKNRYHAALEIVYARQRMMVYNRLMSTMLKKG